MNKEQILKHLNEELVEKFRVAIALGKWPDGKVLTADQRTTCMQAVIVWEQEHLPETERTGYVHKSENACAVHDHDEEKPVKFS